MPPKKSKLCNRSKEARRKRLERAHQSEEQIAARNTTQRIRISESRIQKSKRQRDERLRQNISRNSAAREHHIATFRVRELDRQQTRLFSQTRCWIYSIEWQKRGLPHAYILIWLGVKIISAEIPDPLIDQELFDIVTSHMIHGPCGIFNMTSPCMENGKCEKRFPKQYTNDTVTDIDGYPLYRRRNFENGGHIFTMRMSNSTNQVEIDNQWVVPYSRLLSKTYKAHINVEFSIP
ncbi:helitron_like_N domain-containing protein [Trichonephila clavata]|uniref:Helitron_like_N domain-containing protein n=1 Tax=Trichonephila clavata TaxID=2740835 RepID=A0A8X6G781_TRICU|nr:helitron_like_N domain-containing protein [Trichonephila clavata]